jgi:hypothetical protein
MAGCGDYAHVQLTNWQRFKCRNQFVVIVCKTRTQIKYGAAINDTRDHWQWSIAQRWKVIARDHNADGRY